MDGDGDKAVILGDCSTVLVLVFALMPVTVLELDVNVDIGVDIENVGTEAAGNDDDDVHFVVTASFSLVMNNIPRVKPADDSFTVA